VKIDHYRCARVRRAAAGSPWHQSVLPSRGSAAVADVDIAVVLVRRDFPGDAWLPKTSPRWSLPARGRGCPVRPPPPHASGRLGDGRIAPVRVGPGDPASLRQQQQPEQPEGLGLVEHQLDEKAGTTPTDDATPRPRGASQACHGALDPR
jgi:hypothetical protein